MNFLTSHPDSAGLLHQSDTLAAAAGSDGSPLHLLCCSPGRLQSVLSLIGSPWQISHPAGETQRDAS